MFVCQALAQKDFLDSVLPNSQTKWPRLFFILIKAVENQKLPSKWEHWHTYPFPSASFLGPVTKPSCLMSKQDLKNQCRVTMFWLGHDVGHLFQIVSDIWTNETEVEMGVRTELFLGSTVLETTFPTDTLYIALEKQLKGGCWFRKLPGTLIFEDKFEELIFLYITLRLLASLPLGFIAHG